MEGSRIVASSADAEWSRMVASADAEGSRIVASSADAEGSWMVASSEGSRIVASSADAEGPGRWLIWRVPGLWVVEGGVLRQLWEVVLGQLWEGGVLGQLWEGGVLIVPSIQLRKARHRRWQWWNGLNGIVFRGTGGIISERVIPWCRGVIRWC